VKREKGKGKREKNAWWQTGENEDRKQNKELLVVDL